MGRDPEEGGGGGALIHVRPVRGASGEWTLEDLWIRGGDDFGRTISDVAWDGDLLYAAEVAGFVVALDGRTGEEVWRFDAFAPIWASPTVIDGRLWVADTDGEVTVLALGRELRILSEVAMPAPVHRAPVMADGVVHLLTDGRLWALSTESSGAAP